MAMAEQGMQAISTHLTGHGGRIDEAMRLYPAAAQPWLDLSTGINPVPWQPPASLVVDPHPLPSQSDLRALEAAAACHFQIEPARVAAVPGSEIALRLLPSLDLPAITSVPPGYATHAAITDLTRDTLEAVTGRTLLLANPNNPDGRLIPPDRLLDLAHEQATRGGWLVIDEAFADAVPGSSLLPHLAADAPIIVLRSFGKFFGLAGLRLGFVVAPEAIIARVRHLLGDWPVSAHAIAFGRAAYEDGDWITAIAERLSTRATALDALLGRRGLMATGACPLFRLVQTPDAAAIFDRLARAGILVRPFADRPSWLRFGLTADDAASTRLDRALTVG
jgi:cobalamin biosynthetic protein CobC